MNLHNPPPPHTHTHTSDVSRARICRHFKEPARQPYLSYRPDRLHRLAKSIPRNRFLGSINVYKYELRCKYISRVGGGGFHVHYRGNVLLWPKSNESKKSLVLFYLFSSPPAFLSSPPAFLSSPPAFLSSPPAFHQFPASLPSVPRQPSSVPRQPS